MSSDEKIGDVHAVPCLLLKDRGKKAPLLRSHPD